jgi:hypothetical protein
MNRYAAVFVLAIISLACTSAMPPKAPPRTITLDGTWRYQMDKENRGIDERWYTRRLAGTLTLPGSLQGHGIGDPVTPATEWTGDILDSSWFHAPAYAQYRQPGNIKIPFWLQPETQYAAPAWYQRDIEVPASWKGKRLELTLERPHWGTHVWLDGNEIGADSSLSTAHVYDFGVSVPPGHHVLSIRVDNSLIVDVGRNSHSVSDNTQGNWNGIVGSLTLTATDPVWISDLQVYSHIATGSITVKGVVKNAGGRPGSSTLRLTAMPAHGRKAGRIPPVVVKVFWDENGGTFETEYHLGDSVAVWDEFVPDLYTLTATLEGKDDPRTVSFGMREVSAKGRQLLINGRPLFIRGTLECAIFPRTGHPPTDVASWKRIITVARNHGLNLFRFHSWCPPEAAFIAGDELGFYFQVEAASWPNQSTTLGDGKPIDRWIVAETDRILRAYGNHPSLLLFSSCNEPGGKHSGTFLSGWITHARQMDPRHLYAAGSGWPQISGSDYDVTPNPRIQGWGAGLSSRINAAQPETRTDYREIIGKHAVPVVSHEIGQWCVFPNFAEIPKYTGYLKPKNFEIFRDFLAEHGMGHQAANFLHASGKLQVQCYKEDIESALRTPGMGGFELLDLHDFPGQGTALVGVLDPFWESKGYVTPAEFRRFCNSTVVLARMGQRVYTTGERLVADIEIAHFGRTSLKNAVTVWRLVDEQGVRVAKGSFPASTIPVGNGTALGTVTIDLSTLAAPRRYTLVVGLQGMGIENTWDVWLYPQTIDTRPAAGITIVDDLNDDALSLLGKGGKVLWLVPPERVKGDARGKVQLGFSSIFWNTAWTSRQAPHTLGILCDPHHAALTGFPTEEHSNWQWWYLLHNAGAMILDSVPSTMHPIVQVIDDWFTSRKLALMYEASVGSGKLLVCSVDLKNGLDANPVARQMLHSILGYMAGDKFRPQVALTAEQARGAMVK